MKNKTRLLWGTLLIAAGLLFLAQNLWNVAIGTFLWSSIFGIGGLAFLVAFLNDRDTNWWAAIPGFVLLGLAATMLLDQIPGQVAEAWSDSAFLGGIALAFWAIYLTNREHWWAIIPAGVLSTIALIAGIPALPRFEGVEVGGIFFLGLGLTFVLVAVLPTPAGPMTWALIPAAVLLIMGALTMAAATAVLQYIWPVALIVVGCYLLIRALTKGQQTGES